MYGYRSCEKWAGKNVRWTWLKTLRTLFGLRNVVGGWLCASTRQYYTAGIQMTGWGRWATNGCCPTVVRRKLVAADNVFYGVRIILLCVLPYIWSLGTDLFSGTQPYAIIIYTAPSAVITMMVAPTSSERGRPRAVCFQIPKKYPKPD